jgi:tetratricopeptide (TPR) repeat protein
MQKTYLRAAIGTGLVVLGLAAVYILKYGALEAAMIWAALVFLAGSVIVILGTIRWLSRVDQHALLRSEEKIQNKDALVIGAFFTLLLLLAYCITGAAAAMQFPGRGTAAVLFALTWALASAAVGGSFGFLLGHPRRLTDDKTDRAGISGLLRTGLDDMVDWLVKGLTTVILVQAGPILTHLDHVARQMATGLLGAGATEAANKANLDAAAAFAEPLIVCFTLLGALATCLVTRTYLTGALSRADRTTSGAFGRVELDLGDVLLLSNAQHILTTRHVPPVAEVRQVAEKLAALSLTDLHSVGEFSMWAKAKVMLEQYPDALKGFEKAVTQCDCDPALLMDYAVALHETKKPSEARARLEQAYEHLARATDPDTRRNVYKSLTYELLCTPGNYDRVIQLVDEFERDRETNPAPASGGLLVNKACALGQKFMWIAKQKNLIEEPPNLPFKVNIPGAPSNWPIEHLDLKNAYESALEAVKKALVIDPTWKQHLQLLLKRFDSSPGATSDLSGLEVFERFTEFRALLDLSPYSESAPEVKTEVAAPAPSATQVANVATEQTQATKKTTTSEGS